MAQVELWRWYISPVCVMQVYIQRYLKTVQSDDTGKVKFYRIRPIYHAYGSCFVVFYCELQPVGFTDIHHGYLALVGQIIPHIETLMDIGKSITKNIVNRNTTTKKQNKPCILVEYTVDTTL